MKQRAHVLVAVEAQADLKLCVKFIRIVDDESFDPNALVFEWFTMVGYTRADARRNCVESIAYYLRCRPDLRDAILGAFDASCALEITDAIGVAT